MRSIYIAGNWKMNKSPGEVDTFTEVLKERLQGIKLNNVIPAIFPPSVYLERCRRLLQDSPVRTGAQDVSRHASGAYTGEVSAAMLRSLGMVYSLVGHSERRQYHRESNKEVNEKAKVLLANYLTPVICIGELEEEREKGITKDVILQQLNESLNGIGAHQNIVIAYEPVWAIGTGKTATPEIAQEVHSFIREWLRNNYGKEKADKTSILYGGSIKSSNFSSLMAEEDIDGGLIGGASLDVESFIELIKIGVESRKQ